MPQKPVGNILQQTLPLSLFQRLSLHAKALERVRTVLPEPLAGQCLDCVLNDRQQLIVYVRGAAYGAQIRFYSAQLLEVFRDGEFGPVRQVLVRKQGVSI
jgi:hypothetical protein